MQHYDAIVIGSGQAGNPLASFLSSQGKKTLLIEKDKLGGTCVNTGCTPSKALHEIVKKIYYAQHLSDKGFSVKANLNFEKLMRNVRDLSKASREGLHQSLSEKDGLKLMFGKAAFTGEKEIEVKLKEGGTQMVTAPKIYINTGSRPGIPDIKGLGQVNYLTNLNVFDIHQLPDELVIIGGGFIGVEFAQNFARLGSKVTLVNRGKQIIGPEDDDIIESVAHILEDDGVNIIYDFDAKAISHKGDKYILSEKEGKRILQATQVLITAGRVPNSKDLKLENTGIKADSKGFISVNERLETSVKGIYALGEVAGSAQFTHISYDDFRIVRNNILNEGKQTTAGRPNVYALFTDPQLGRFGLNEKQASKENIDYECFSIPASSIARAKEKCETKGLVKVLTEKKSGKIIGGSILLSEGGELMSLLQVAATANVNKDQLKEMIFTHPLLAESLNNLF